MKGHKRMKFFEDSTFNSVSLNGMNPTLGQSVKL